MHLLVADHPAVEAVGYVGRAINAKQSPDWAKTPFILESILLLLGPTLLAASVYMVLARLIRYLDADSYSIIRTRWLTKVFVLGDIISFLCQSAGGGMLAQAKTQSDVDNANHIILLGLGVQVVFFGFFILTTVVFHVRIAKHPTARSQRVTAPWRAFIIALYVSSICIMVRSIYRMAEYGQGPDGELQSKEVYLLILDGLLMFIVTAVFVWYHPSRVLSQDGGYKDVKRNSSDVELGTQGLGNAEQGNQGQAAQPMIQGAVPKPYDGTQQQTAYDPAAYGYGRNGH
jgi:hypothetical protein